MKIVRGYLFPLLVYMGTLVVAQDGGEVDTSLLRGRRKRKNRQKAAEAAADDAAAGPGRFPTIRTIKMTRTGEQSLRAAASTNKYKINLWDLKQLAKLYPESREEILRAKLENTRDGFGTYQGEFGASYVKKLQKAPLTETFIRAVQDRDYLELSGLAPKPKHFYDLAASSVVRTDPEEAVCRFTDEGVVCESPHFHEDVGEGASLMRRRRKRRKKRKKKKKPAGGATDGSKKKKKKKRPQKFGSWVDNGMGMLCNGWKCKPKPTRFPQPTTTKATPDGQLNDEWGRISFDKLYKTLIEMNTVHPLKKFKYLNLNGNLLVGDISKLEDILCLMPQIEEVSFQACGMQGVLPPNTFRCVQHLRKADFKENGFWCAKNAFNKALKHYAIDDDGKPVWDLMELDFEMNPMTSRCYFIKTGNNPHTIAKTWNFQKQRDAQKTTINEWADAMKECINEEPNCLTNSPAIDLMFFSK